MLEKGKKKTKKTLFVVGALGGGGYNSKINMI